MEDVTGDQHRPTPVPAMPVAEPSDFTAPDAPAQLSYRPPGRDARQRVRLVTAYVLAAVQIPVVAFIFVATAGSLREWSALHGSDRAAGIMIALVGLAGAIAVAGLLFWRYVPWRLTFAGQVILSLAELAAVMAMLPFLAGACGVGLFVIAHLACVMFAPYYLWQDHVRAAFADEPDPWTRLDPDDWDLPPGE
jgi:hypothetical protein